MTRCRDVDRLATAYLDGALDERRSSALRGHLRVCPRCAERVEDEARIAQLAADLEPVDPSPSMWQAIDARLAEAEIRDSRRPALWLLVQRLRDGARRNALVLGSGVAAAAVLALLWLPGREPGREPGSGGAPERASAAPAAPEPAIARTEPLASREDPPAPEPGCSGAPTQEEQLLCQMHEADRRYLDSIAELVDAVAEERASWIAADAARFDAALADLDRAATVERLRLAGQPAAAGPAVRDPLYAIYRAKIDLLTSAVVAGDPSGAATRRGGP